MGPLKMRNDRELYVNSVFRDTEYIAQRATNELLNLMKAGRANEKFQSTNGPQNNQTATSP